MNLDSTGSLGGLLSLDTYVGTLSKTAKNGHETSFTYAKSETLTVEISHSAREKILLRGSKVKRASQHARDRSYGVPYFVSRPSGLWHSICFV